MLLSFYMKSFYLKNQTGEKWPLPEYGTDEQQSVPKPAATLKKFRKILFKEIKALGTPF